MSIDSITKGATIKREKTIMDWPAFILSIAIVLVVSIPIIFWPDQATAVINAANVFVLKYFGGYYMVYGLAAVAFIVFIAFSKVGSILLGGPEAKPEYNLLTWIAMNVCAGTGSGIVLWGATEWIYYYTAPPLGVEFGSDLAGELSVAYGMFHWGLIGNAIYVIGAAAVAYLIFVRKQNVLRLNDACSSVLGKQTHGALGTLVNVSFVFGLIGASATTLGTSTPMVGACLSYVFGIEYGFGIQLVSLIIVTALFATSVALGMKEGIARLSNINIVLAFIVLAWTLLCGNTMFIIDEAITASGLIVTNFFRMSTWLDPIGMSNFGQDWTCFYWAFYIAFAPFMAVFLARISYGRTVRSMLVIGCIGAAITGGLHQTILGGHGLFLQTSGQLDVIGSLAANGQGPTVVNVLATLPGGKITILTLALLCIIFLATQFDSAAYVLGAATQKNLDENGDPHRWLRLLWAFMLFLVPLGFLLIGAPLGPLKTMVIVLALPMSFVLIITVVSFLKMVYEDKDKGIIVFKESWISSIKTAGTVVSNVTKPVAEIKAEVKAVKEATNN